MAGIELDIHRLVEVDWSLECKETERENTVWNRKISSETLLYEKNTGEILVVDSELSIWKKERSNGVPSKFRI